MSAGSNHDRDQAWYDALTGRAEGGSVDEREGDALRKVLLDEDQRTDRRTRPGNVDGLLRRLEQEGLVDPQQRPAQRPRWLAIAASVALAAIAVPLVIDMQRPPPELIEIPRGTVEPIEVTSATPEQTSDELATQLTDLGAAVQRYEFEGRWIVDAQVGELPQRRLRRLLERVGVAVPEDGRLLLAFASGSGG